MKATKVELVVDEEASDDTEIEFEVESCELCGLTEPGYHDKKGFVCMACMEELNNQVSYINERRK